MTPWPGAMASYAGQTVRIEQTRVSEADGVADQPGAVVGESADGGLRIACGRGTIDVLRVRPAGKTTMDAQAWWRGTRADAAMKPKFERVRDEETP